MARGRKPSAGKNKSKTNDTSADTNNKSAKPVPKVTKEDLFYIPGQLDEESRFYFQQTLDMFEAQNDEKEKRLIASGVLAELERYEVQVVCKDSVGARVIEAITSCAKPKQLVELFKLMSPTMAVMMGHATCSFCVQAVLEATSRFINNNNNNSNNNDNDKDNLLLPPFLEFLETLSGTWEKMILHASVSFVARSIIRILGDLPQSDDQEDNKDAKPRNPNAAFEPILKQIATELLQSKKSSAIYVFCLNANASPCLSTLFRALDPESDEYIQMAVSLLGVKKTKKDEKAKGKKNAGDSDSDSESEGEDEEDEEDERSTEFGQLSKKTKRKVAAIARDTAAVRVIEAILASCNDMMLDGFKFLIRAIQANARTPQQIESLLNKLLGFLPVILRMNKGYTYLPEILGIGINWPEYQPKVFQGFVEAMCKEDDDRLSMFKDIIMFHSLDGEFSPTGVSVLKAMWNFSLETKKPLLRSVYKTDSELLVKAACSNKKILDTMVSAPDTPPSVAHKLVSRLSNYIKQMAKDQYGSYFVEKLYEKSDVKRKEKIIKNLVEIHPQLNTTPFGRVLIVKTHLDQYKNNPKFWQKSVKKDSVDRRSFVEVANLEKKKPKRQTEDDESEEDKDEKLKSKKQNTKTTTPTKNNDNSQKPLTDSQAAFLANLKTDLAKRKSEDVVGDENNKRKEIDAAEGEPSNKKQKTEKLKKAEAKLEALRLKKQVKIERNRIQKQRRQHTDRFKGKYKK